MIAILSLFQDGKTVHIPVTVPDPARPTSQKNMDAYARIADGRALDSITYPDRAISIRQPWAWAIMEAGKDCENRSRKICHPGWYFVHSGYNVDLRAYHQHREHILQSTGVSLPKPPDHVPTGGVIGLMKVKEWITESASPWFMGPAAAVIEATVALPFQAGPGLLGCFKWDHERAEA